ncbi:MAG: hypothetical protein AB7P67_07185 [Vicinamibacterales bacterium]
MPPKRKAWPLLAPVLWFLAVPAGAQTLETVGTRASGMAGAFVAVASDSSAVWWNPGALAAGPFVEVALGHGGAGDAGPGSHVASGTTALALTLPMAGLHVARYTVAGAAPARGPAQASRVAVSQVGVTVVQSLVSGVHVGGTLKYLRGASAAELRFGPLSGAVDRARDLDLPDGQGAWDADLGLAVVHRGWRLGLLARQLAEPEFGRGGDAVRLGRHVRAGAAFDAAAAGGPPVTVAADVDLTATAGPDGARRDVAVGVEHWLRAGRVGVRAGLRASTVDEARPVATAGASLMVRSGLFLEISGGSGGSDRHVWGATARVTF